MMIDRVIEIIMGIAIAIPLPMFVLYLIKNLKDTKDTDSRGKFKIRIFSFFILTIIAAFLFFFIFVKLVFINIVEIPTSINVIGILLFFLYYFGAGALLYGLGTLGHGGVSPSKILRELYNDLFRKKK